MHDPRLRLTGRARTCDFRTPNAALFQLSYNQIRNRQSRFLYVRHNRKFEGLASCSPTRSGRTTDNPFYQLLKHLHPGSDHRDTTVHTGYDRIFHNSFIPLLCFVTDKVYRMRGNYRIYGTGLRTCRLTALVTLPFVGWKLPSTCTCTCTHAGRQGFEPWTAVLETAILPTKLTPLVLPP